MAFINPFPNRTVPSPLPNESHFKLPLRPFTILLGAYWHCHGTQVQKIDNMSIDAHQFFPFRGLLVILPNSEVS
jgi:hypothetical protein